MIAGLLLYVSAFQACREVTFSDSGKPFWPDWLEQGQTQFLRELAPEQLLHRADSLFAGEGDQSSGPPVAEAFEAHLLRAAAYFQEESRSPATTELIEAVRLALAVGDTLLAVEAMTLADMGKVGFEQAKLLAPWLPMAIRVMEMRAPSREEAWLLEIYGSYLLLQQDLAGAQPHLLRAYHIFEQLQDHEGLLQVKMDLANNYWEIGSHDEATKYIQAILDNIERVQTRAVLANLWINLGIYFRRTSQFDQAIEAYLKAMDCIDQEKEIYRKLQIKYNIANVQFDKGALGQALRTYQEVLEEARLRGVNAGVAVASSGIAAVYEGLGQYPQAVDYLMSGEAHADSIGMTSLIISMRRQRMDLLAIMGRYNAALELGEALATYHDSIDILERDLAIHELGMAFDASRKELENSAIRREIQDQEQLMHYRHLGLTLTTLLVILMIYNLKKLKERTRQLQRAYAVIMEDMHPKMGGGAAYQTSEDAEGRDARLMERLQHYMVVEKAYLQSRLKMEQVAELLDVPQKELSRVLRLYPFRNFNHFLNHFRVEQAKVILSDPNRTAEKMEQVAQGSGFGNKQSFYTAFEKLTGLTPSHYREFMLAQASKISVPTGEESDQQTPGDETENATL